MNIFLLFLALSVVECSPVLSDTNGRTVLRNTNRSQPRDVLIFTDGGPIPEYLLQNSYELYPIPYAGSRFLRQKSRRRVPRRRTTSNNETTGTTPESSVRNLRLQMPQHVTAATLQPNLASSAGENGIFLPPRIVFTSNKTTSTPEVRLESNEIARPERRLENDWQSPVTESSVSSPYGFGYRIDDGHGSTQHRQESSDGHGVVRGSYGFKDYLGIYRLVNYIADRDGFRVLMKTNEPGVDAKNPADVLVVAEPPPLEAIIVANKYLEEPSNSSRNYSRDLQKS